MAKVYMPLLSAQASGKLAKSMVHFYWKGLNVVRQWVIPTNPRDVDQRIIRQKLAAMGKNLAAIETPGATLAGGSTLYQLLVAETPANMIWNAYFVKQTLQYVKTDANMVDLWSDLTNDSNLGAWTAAADDLGLVALTGVEYATTIPPELQLFMGAYAAYQLDLSGLTDQYSTYPSNWATTVVQDFAREYTAAT